MTDLAGRNRGASFSCSLRRSRSHIEKHQNKSQGDSESHKLKESVKLFV